MFQDTWAMPDSKPVFENTLRDRGFHLVRGDRRGHVAVDFMGEVYPISRWTGVRAKDVRARLGGIDALPSVDQVTRDAKEVIVKQQFPLK